MSTVYIVSNHGKLNKKGETLHFYAKDGTITIIFPYKTEQLIIMGNVEITSAALKLLMKYNLDTVFLNKNGKFNGKIVFQESKNVFLRQKQFELLHNNKFKLNFSKTIVRGKLKNQLTFMQRIRRRDRGEENIVNRSLMLMKKTIADLDEATNLESIRGYEGIGAKYYFSVFRYNIIQDWANFNGRSMHPPQDNVNAVLSFLYTILFYRIDGLVEAEGLDPYVGYLHELNYGKRSLSFDLMEEFRTPIVDTLCCSLFNLGILEENDFEEVTFSTESVDYPLQSNELSTELNENQAYEEKRGILLTNSGIKKVIPQFEKKLDSQIFYEPLNRQTSYRRVIREQIKQFKRVIKEEESFYKPLVVK